jgi:transposase
VYLLEQQLIPYARVRELLADLLGAPVSVGTLLRWVRQGSQTLRPVEEQIKAALGRAPVLHSDETGVRRAGVLAWAHVASTNRLTHYAIDAKRGREATDAIGILPGYQGVSVHDGWKPSRAYTQCRHALCNIHHLRELTFLEEEYQQGWANDLKGLLLAMKEAVAQARTRGGVHAARRRASRLPRPLRRRAGCRVGGQSPARAQARPAGTRQAISRAQSARASADRQGRAPGFPRRLRRALRQQSR